MTNKNNKKSLFSIGHSELLSFFESIGEKPFRYQQVLEWIINKKSCSFDEMKNIPKNLRKKLSRTFVISWPFVKKHLKSKDKSVKYIISVNNNDDLSSRNFIETVFMPDLVSDSSRNTLCISSQVGCPMQCSFCATGKQGFTRNLSFLEIISQIILVENDLNVRISNIVFMGQGEPFLNFDEVNEALNCINNKSLLNIGSRKITLSTCGIIPSIKKFSMIKQQFGLAVSLHSAIQQTRNVLMPKVSNYNLEELKKCLLEYNNKTNRRISFEYILIDNINDDEKHLKALIKYCKGLLVHINLIMLNYVDGSKYKPVSKAKVKFWLVNIKKSGIEATLRNSRGTDINAACGQLLNQIS